MKPTDAHFPLVIILICIKMQQAQQILTNFLALNIEPEEAPAYFRMCSFKYICVHIHTFFFFTFSCPTQLLNELH